MAKFVWSDAFLSVGGTDLSDHVESIQLAYTSELLDATCMGDTARTYVEGFADWTLEVTFRQDHAAASTDATLFPLIGGGAAAVVVRPTSGVVGAGNPEFTGNAILTSYDGPVSGTVNQVANASASFQGSGALARAIA